MPTRLQRQAQHLAERVAVFDEEHHRAWGAASRRLTSAEPAGRHARFAGFVLDVAIALVLRGDLALHALELGDRLLAVLAR